MDARLGRGGEHGEADNGADFVGKHEDTALFQLVGEESSTDGEAAGNDVRRDGHQLRLLVGVTHVLDDGWEEERDGVKWSVDTDGDEHVNVDLPVLESVHGVLQIEFICQGAAIRLEATLNFDFLFWSKEFGTRQVSDVRVSEGVEDVR